MNCKFLKQKLNQKLECKLTNNIITFKDCKECKEKEYKSNIMISNNSIPNIRKSNDFPNNRKMVTKSKKLAKMERNRTSILTDDMEHCIICGKTKNHLHEVFQGSHRKQSMIWKMVLPLCFLHHNEIHSNRELSLYYKRLCQQKFEEKHSRDEFIKIFGRSYLD